MANENYSNSDRELLLLEQIERDPDVNQATMAAQLGVAVGTVNWHIKRFIAKGYVKVKRAQRRKLRYIITPEGLAFRARLTVNYIESSMHLYRKTRIHVRELITELHNSGYEQVRINGDGDIADICRLTCLEQGVKIIESPSDMNNNNIPALVIKGTRVNLNMET